MTNANFWNKINDVNGQRDSTWLRPGRYLAYIDRFYGKELRSGGQAAFFEFTIIAVLDDSAGAADPDGPHRVGDKASWMFSLRFDVAWSSLKTALSVITGVASSEIKPDVCAELSANDQPLHGLVVEIDGKMIVTEKNRRSLNQAFVKRVVSKEEVAEMVPNTVLKSLHVTLV